MPQRSQTRKEVEAGQEGDEDDKQQRQAGKDGYSIPVFHGLAQGCQVDDSSTAVWKRRLRAFRRKLVCSGCFFDILDSFVSSQVPRFDGEFVDAVVDRVVGMAFDFDPRDLVPRGLLQETFPQIFVFDRLFGCRAPPFALPVVEPAFVEGADEVGAVGMEGDAAGLFERAQCFEGSRQFHAIIGGVWDSAAEDALVPAVLQHRRPATGAGVSGTATVGIDDDVFQKDGVWVLWCLG